MTSFNKDYSDLKRQLENIEKYLMTCFSSSEIYDYIMTRNTLREYTGKEANFDWKDIRFLPYEGKAYYTNLIVLKHNFRMNRDYHQKFLSISYPIVNRIHKNIKVNFDSLGYTDYHVFSNDKDIKLLNAFFEEEDPILKDIFDDMRKYQRIYYDKKKINPYCLYNNLEDIPNIFMHPRRKYKHTLEDLTDLVHELGHVKTDMEISSKNKRKALEYSYQSLYQEVMPSYYEQRFLDFLIENGIYKKEAKDILVDNLSVLTSSFEKCNKYFDRNYEKSFEHIRYCYGSMIASYLVAYPKTMKSFSKIQYDRFSSIQLEETGFTPEFAVSSLEKKMKTYFKI